MYFLAFTAHVSATSRLRLVSSMVFFTISPNNLPSCSFNPLLYGHSAEVADATVFKFYTICLNDGLLNSLPLLVTIDLGFPKFSLQCLKMALMMSELSIRGILTVTSCTMVDQLYYFVATDFVDVHCNTFFEIWS